MRAPLVAAIAAIALGAPPVAAAPPAAPASAPAGGDHVARVEHHAPDQPPSVGPRGAPVTIELFFVPGVASSNGAYRNLIALQSKHPRRIRLVLRPLERQGHLQGPEAALEAHVQGHFFDFMDAALDTARPLREKEVETIAADIGLDFARVQRAWADERHRAVLDDNERRRVLRHGRNTPEMLLNGQPATRPVGAMDPEELEETYRDAYDRAAELIAEGVPVERLDDELTAASPPPPVTISLGPVDDPRPTAAAASPALLKHPLRLAGLPSIGPATARVPILVLCNLRYHSCVRQISAAVKVAERFPDDVRVVWSPWSSDDSDDGPAVDLLHRAALCAQDQDAGWRWVEQALGLTQRSHGRWGDGRAEIEDISEQAEIDRKALDHCLRTGNPQAARRRVRAAVQAGVIYSPSVVVGGRIYLGGPADMRILQALVEDELASGLLERASPDRPLRSR